VERHLFPTYISVCPRGQAPTAEQYRVILRVSLHGSRLLFLPSRVILLPAICHFLYVLDLTFASGHTYTYIEFLNFFISVSKPLSILFVNDICIFLR